MKKLLTLLFTLSLFLLLAGCSNSTSDSKSDSDSPSDTSSASEPDGDFIGTITALDHPVTYYVSFWIDGKTSVHGEGGYHYYVYSDPKKTYKSRVHTQRNYGSSRYITVTNDSIHYSLDVELYSADGGNSYSGTFNINSIPFTGTITRQWLSITSKDDLVGKWSTSTITDPDTKISLTNYFVIANDYSTKLQAVYNYKKATQDFIDSLPTIKQKAIANGYKVDDNESSKTLTLTYEFTAAELNALISSGELKICQSKDDIQYKKTIFSKVN